MLGDAEVEIVVAEYENEIIASGFSPDRKCKALCKTCTICLF